MATISYDEICYSEITGKPLTHHDWIYYEKDNRLNHVIDGVIIDSFVNDVAYKTFYNLIHDDKKTVKKESTKNIHKQADKRCGYLVCGNSVKEDSKEDTLQTNIFDE